ncbi:MAG: U32 family peptidase [Rikenellaceae bacterium]
MKQIELLAPAKNLDAARAAIDHGADAIYIGAPRFGARAAASNSVEEIARAVEYAHQYGARLYATLNTLIYEEELRDSEAIAREVVAAGVDALIVQDLAFARMGLGVELHSSTQMCNTTPEGVRFLADCGFSRVVLERNLTLEEIRAIGNTCSAELEVFVHGAICVGNSGRCMLSRSMNPTRSGNRGECSQPCRVRYDLRDGEGREIVSSKHLLSVRDLNLSNRVGDLIDCGATSLKIEGRLKELSYTKNIVAHYRRIVDRAISERDGYRRSSIGRSTIEFEPDPAKSFSRGATEYLLDGQRSGLASLDTPKALGEEVGRVVAQRGERIEVRLTTPLSNGDGVCCVSGGELVGSSVNRSGEGWVELNRAVVFDRNAVLYRNFDRQFEASVESSRTRRKIVARASIRSCPNAIEVEYCDEDGYIGNASADGLFEAAKSHEKMRQTICTQLAKTGDTIFDTQSVETELWGGEFVAVSQLSSLRREALNDLREKRLEGAKVAPHKIFEENHTPLYPTKVVGGEVGVTNSLAAAFYRDHGVEQIEPSYERAESLRGARVLVSSYCIRREIGECLRRGSKVRDELFLVRGEHRFRLKFDCAKCRMSLIKM